MSKWISVKDRLPDSEYEILKHYSRVANYIVCNNKGIVFVARWKEKSFDGKLTNYFRCLHYPKVLKNITHWQPLPEPPEQP